MVKQTRDDIINSATRHFADRGFYGASIAEIASDLGVTKQALLHHFGTKEKLYGEVLQGISQHFIAQVIQAATMEGDPAKKVEDVLLALHANAQTARLETQLLMRELLDNKRRAATAQAWYLKPFLDALIAMLKRTKGWADASDAEALAAIYQALGAINYFAISEETLSHMFGAGQMQDVEAAYPGRLRLMIRQIIAAPPERDI